MQWEQGRFRKPTPEQAAKMFRRFKACFPPWPYDEERQQAMVESYIELFTMYPFNALEQAMKDFRLGKIKRDERSVNFMPTPQEFGQHIRSWARWVISKPAHLDTREISDAVVEHKMQIAGLVADGRG